MKIEKVHAQVILLPEWNDLPILQEGEVHVYALRSDDDPILASRAEHLLSKAERERASRIRVERARDEFVVGRAALRVLLGSALNTAPEDLPIQVDGFGKPYVPGVHCNVSHSRGLIYVALCRQTPVGVDVEWIDPGLEALEIAEANFRPEETREIAALPDGAARAKLFCWLWTRKEAVAKANGRGLQVSLRDIVLPGASTGTAWIGPEGTSPSGASGRFALQELPAPEGFAASLAIRGEPLPVRFLRLPLPINVRRV